MRKLIFLLLFALPALAQSPTRSELSRWKQHAANTTITRDDWGIAHVYGKTDADAVFGAEYAQAEDDFNRVETNYLNSLGRLAEAEGEAKIIQDLRQRLFIDESDLKKDYANSPEWLQKLMDAFADGLNFYLYMHPETHARAITHFEPWMALSFTEGSIGGDIERVQLAPLAAFYTNSSDTAALLRRYDLPAVDPEAEPAGSNGIAIAPSDSADHHALLLINPHTTFFFRSELEMTSDEGLHAYGASTWGQFFIYQGFNDHLGWMHTSSGVDSVDEFEESVSEGRDGKYTYKYGSEERPVTEKQITISYKTRTGMKQRTFTAYFTHHGPVIRKDGDKWVAIALMNKPIPALEQSYLRTKANSYGEYLQTMDYLANSSNNTIFASTAGDIAYWHPNFIPRRDDRFDYTKPVDGSDPRTDWHGLLKVTQIPQLHNPKSGWLYNSNNAPWSAAGAFSEKKSDFPKYIDMGGETARGQHALRILNGQKDLTLEGFMRAAYDSYLTWFDKTLPALFRAYDALPQDDAMRANLKEPMALLRGWDHRSALDSVPTSVAVFWGTALRHDLHERHYGSVEEEDFVADNATPQQLLTALNEAVDRLTNDFGKWQTPWGEINRFQRLDDAIEPHFDDAQPSVPVEFTSALWGSLASFGAKQYPNTKKWYGTSGNSFVAVVDFGPRIRALAVTAGGESGDPHSKHFNDQAQRYATGNLREVYFYPEQLKGHTERVYHPGEGKGVAK